MMVSRPLDGESEDSQKLHFAIVPHGSDAYAATVALRLRVLREPLGRGYTVSELEQERPQIHVACYNFQRLVACLVLAPISEAEVKMRQVAVAPEFQRLGIGSALVRHCEQFAQSRGYSRMTLHARVMAMPFYQRLGYHRLGEEFLEVCLPHVAMWKDIAGSVG